MNCELPESTAHPATDGDVHWFALWTRSRHEKVVRQQLTEKHVEAFLPTITAWSRWKDRKKQITAPLFPGYCFARFDPAHRLPVLQSVGVVSIVSVAGKPAPIPNGEIASIRQLVESDLAYEPCPFLNEGDLVEVIQGPLRGVVGRLVRKDDKARLMVSVELIGQAVSVHVHGADVRRV